MWSSWKVKGSCEWAGNMPSWCCIRSWDVGVVSSCPKREWARVCLAASQRIRSCNTCSSLGDALRDACSWASCWRSSAWECKQSRNCMVVNREIQITRMLSQLPIANPIIAKDKTMSTPITLFSSQQLSTTPPSLPCASAGDLDYAKCPVHLLTNLKQPILTSPPSIFNSNFESGNLASAEHHSNSFDLSLHQDINTKGHTQWFYFSVSSLKGEYTFNINNLSKPKTLYTQGMQISVHTQERGWHKGGYNIRYRKLQDSSSNLYQLSFTYRFHNQTVFFAHAIPYTVSDLNLYLSRINHPHFTRQILCRTLLGNRVEKVTISNPQDQKKGAIVIMARAHPGETVSSYVVEGLINYLLSSHGDEIRKNYLIKVLPIINPDGVIVGNYRCSLSGSDLNRRWSDPNRQLHPEIFYAKQLISSLQNVRMVIDLHGHNIKKGFFMYGCSVEGIQVPYNLSLLNSNFFLTKCSFKVTKSKLSTARVTLWKELKVSNVFTLESSFMGNNSRAFSVEDYRQMGRDIGRMLGLSRFEQVREMPTFEEDSCGSESQPSQDNLSQNDIEEMLGKNGVHKKKNRKGKSLNLPSIQKQSKSLDNEDTREQQKTEINREYRSERKYKQKHSLQNPQQLINRSRQPSEKKHYTEIPIKIFEGYLLPHEEENRERKGLKQLLNQKNRYNLKMFLFQQQPFRVRNQSLNNY